VLVEDELENVSVYDNEIISKLHRRREDHINGTSKSYTYEESLEMIRGQKK
jgi:hypothetical protein